MDHLYNFFKLFDNISEPVYVSDAESCEILYMNRKCMENCGIFSLDELKGRKCCETLLGNGSPRASCANEMPPEGGLTERNFSILS